MDPLAGSTWSAPGTVAGFAQSPPNPTLVRFAGAELRRGGQWALDVGCGAARNTVPLAQLGWNVLAVDLARPMIEAAAARTETEGVSTRVRLALAPMHALPAVTGSMDLIVAHGIWNLARSGDEFRQAVREASRVARPGAALFVFTFSRRTLPRGAQPVAGETFVYTQFSGEPQCFLTEPQLIAELGAAGFIADAAVPLTEHNVPRPGAISTGTVPVIYEIAFRATGTSGLHDIDAGQPSHREHRGHDDPEPE
jgi:SAM-dependent methyltransferase